MMDAIRGDTLARNQLINYAETRIASLKDKAVALDVEPRMADHHRGAIAELKKLLTELQNTGEHND